MRAWPHPAPGRSSGRTKWGKHVVPKRHHSPNAQLDGLGGGFRSAVVTGSVVWSEANRSHAINLQTGGLVQVAAYAVSGDPAPALGVSVNVVHTWEKSRLPS
jgi:hypothetical protein